MDALRARTYPEVGAGGYSRVDGTVDFYTRVNALLHVDMVVLDLGAGRAEWSDDPVPFRRGLRTLRGKVAEVVGIDVDPVVTANPTLDRAIVISPGDPWPLADGSIDLVLGDHVLEHVDDPAFVAAELARVLRPGGWICARTPNRWGYIGIGGRVVPNRLHRALLRRLQPGRREEDVFVTRYRLNSEADLRTHFPSARWDHHSYVHTSEPTYAGSSGPAWLVMRVLARLTPRRFGATRMVFLRLR